MFFSIQVNNFKVSFFLIFSVLFIPNYVALAQVPQAIQDLPLREWRAISLNTLSDVDPCPARDCAWSGVEGQSGVINDWTGGAFATNEGALGGLLYFGGGHNGYYGNEVYFFDLQTLMWSRRNDPTDGQTPGDASSYATGTDCRYYDGAPLPPHTYDSVVYDPTTNSFMMLTVSDVPSIAPGRMDGCGSTIPAIFDLDTNTWTSATAAGPSDLRHGPTAYDPNRKIFWGRTGYFAPRLFVSYDPAADAWQQYSDDAISIDSVGAIDPTRDLFVALDFRHTPRKVSVRDLSQPALATVEVSRTGATEIEDLGKGSGFEWAPRLGAFLVWESGMDLYTLTPPSGDWRTENWVWQKITTTGADPGTVLNDPYSKFQWVDSLGIALINPAHDRPTYAIKLEAVNDSSTPRAPQNLRMKP